MTLAQMRLMYGLITDAVTALAQGGEAMGRLTEVYVARGGGAAVNALLVEHPEAEAEINQFAALITDVTPIVAMLQGGLMEPGSVERSVLMERRGDA